MINISLNRLGMSALAAMIGLSPLAATPALSQNTQRTIDITRPLGGVQVPALRSIIPIDMRVKGCTYRIDRRGKRETMRLVVNAIAPGSQGSPSYIFEDHDFNRKGAFKLLGGICDNDHATVCSTTIFRFPRMMSRRETFGEGHFLLDPLSWHPNTRSLNITCQRRT